MFKKFAILVGVDLVGLGLWIWTEQPGNDMAILGVVVPPVLLVANLLLVLLCLLLQQSGWRTAFLLNAVAAPLLYGLLLTSWFRYSLARQFTTFTFTQGQKYYTLTLNKRNTSCDILERQSPSTSLGLLIGEYRVSNDTTYLHDPRRGEHWLLLPRIPLSISGQHTTDSVAVSRLTRPDLQGASRLPIPSFCWTIDLTLDTA